MRYYIFSLYILFLFFINCKSNDKEVDTEQVLAIENTIAKDSIQVGVFKSGNRENENRLVVSYPITEYPYINSNEKKYALSFVNQFNSDFRNANKKSSNLITGIDLIQHFDIPFHNNNLISFLYTNYASTGNEYKIQKRAIIYDLKAQKKLAIEHTFKNFKAFKDFAAKVKEIAQDSIIQRIDNSKDFDKEKKESLKNSIETKLQQGTSALQENYNTFYFTPDGYWHLFINDNKIAPSELGSFQLDFSPEEIAPFINESLMNTIKNAPLPITLKSLANHKNAENDSMDCNTGQCVALTFDLSPNNTTNELLEVLKKQDVKATFFVLGQFAKDQPAVLKRILENGHSIGNQSLTHRDFVRLTKEEATQEINKTDSIIEYITGFKPQFFRFPYGTYSQEKLEKVNKPIMAYTKKIEAFKNAEIDSLSQQDFSDLNGMIIEHDINSLPPQEVEKVIEALKSKGFHFVTLEQLFKGRDLKNGKVYFSRNEE